jgi:hypothetical protein
VLLEVLAGQRNGRHSFVPPADQYGARDDLGRLASRSVSIEAGVLDLDGQFIDPIVLRQLFAQEQVFGCQMRAGCQTQPDERE